MDPYQSPTLPSDSHGPQPYRISELGMGEILDQAIQLTKNHFGLFFGITAVLLIPLQIVGMIWANIAIPPVLRGPPANVQPEIVFQALAEYFIKLAPLFLISGLVVVPLTNAALIHAIASKYLGAPVSVSKSFSRALSRAPALIFTWFLVGAAIMGGMMLCCLPGILAAFYFALATQITVVEGVSGFAALKRSVFLMKGNVATLFVLGLLVGAINFGINYGLQLIPNP
jgi:uncharacterized membrane protein